MEEYLKYLYTVLYMCNLTLNNRYRLPSDLVEDAERRKEKTEKEIEFYRLKLERSSSLGKTQNNGTGCEGSTANGF